MTKLRLDAILEELKELTASDKLELAKALTQEAESEESPTPIDLNVFAGTINWPVDPLEWQRQIRSEWERS